MKIYVFRYIRFASKSCGFEGRHVLISPNCQKGFCNYDPSLCREGSFFPPAKGRMKLKKQELLGPGEFTGKAEKIF